MKAWLDWVMWRRARQITNRLQRWILRGCRVADIGSGTGHNAAVWRQELQAVVDEFDVADLHWVGPGPRLIDGSHLPASDNEYSMAILVFVLQYASQPQMLLEETARIGSGHVILLQSTYHGCWGRAWLAVRGWIWGPVAFRMARVAGIVKGQPCSLASRTLYSRTELTCLFQQAGLTIRHWEPRAWWGLGISRDLYLLEVTEKPTCRSSSPPAMKAVG